VIDSRLAGRDAGEVLDGRAAGIPVVASLDEALRAAGTGAKPTHFVIGLAPDGGRLPAAGRQAVRRALEAGLHVDSGLHDFLSEDAELAALAAARGLRLRDVRKPPPRSELHFFAGKIEQVTATKLAVLGTDSAVGKRTTAWILVDALGARGIATELVGTGQTAWMQGARFSLVLDSLVNDFVAGEIEHAVWSAWKAGAEVVVIEGQGSLMNPAYPGGYEILAAGRPDAVIMQHAPARREYDGFPGYLLDPLARQIEAVEMISRRPVVAITLNHEGLDPDEVPAVCDRLAAEIGRPVFDVLRDGADGLVEALRDWLPGSRREEA
jgi:uncharacterized NAD-dependent epimerase/dehydratase family protein